MTTEAGEVVAIILGSTAGLTALFYGGRAILRGLGLWKVSNRADNLNESSSPSASMSRSQTASRDQRPVTRYAQHSGTRRRHR